MTVWKHGVSQSHHLDNENKGISLEASKGRTILVI